MAHEIAVFGHSFVSRLLYRGWASRTCGLMRGEFRVFMHGVSGLTLTRAGDESDVVVNLTLLPHMPSS